MLGLLLRGRRSWQRGSPLSPQLCMCCPFRSTHQGTQHQLSNIKALLTSPPGVEGSVNQNGGLLCACFDRLKPLKTAPLDVLTHNKTLGSCSGGGCSDKSRTKDCLKSGHHSGFACYPHPSETATALEPKSVNSSNAMHETLCKVVVIAATASSEHSSSLIWSLPQSRRVCLGLWSWRKPDLLGIGSRLFFSANFCSVSARKTKTSRVHKSQSPEDAVVHEAAADVVEADTDALSSKSDEDFDFRTFPALTSSFFQGYERPTEMEVKKRVTWQTTRKLFDADSKLTLDSIPKPKGRAYNFGLGDMSSEPPPLEAGARPQGGFDTNISLDECEAAPSEAASKPLVFTPRMPSRNLPWGTPEADNWSEISTDEQRDEETTWKREQEFSWDPYDFDANTNMPHKLDFEDNFSASAASR